MRRVRYAVAMSLDAYIAGPGGEYDWIIMDPAIDFRAFFEPIDTVLMGRGSFELALEQGRSGGGMPGMNVFVFSRTLRPEDHPDVRIEADAVSTVAALREEPGKDIWLFGGGKLFRSLVEADLVDTVEVAVIPILLGQGIPLLPTMPGSVHLDFTDSETYPSGIVALRYAVRRSALSLQPFKEGRKQRMSQSTQAALEHHLGAFADGIDSVMEDYTESSVVITPDATYRGLDEIRGFFAAFIEGASEEFWGAFELKRREIVGDVAYIVWDAKPDVAFATDTFVVRDGKFAFQTFAAYSPSA